MTIEALYAAAITGRGEWNPAIGEMKLLVSVPFDINRYGHTFDDVPQHQRRTELVDWLANLERKFDRQLDEISQFALEDMYLWICDIAGVEPYEE